MLGACLMVTVASDIEIARAAKKLPIIEVGAKLGIPAEDLAPYGYDKAKIGAGFIAAQATCSPGLLQGSDPGSLPWRRYDGGR